MSPDGQFVVTAPTGSPRKVIVLKSDSSDGTFREVFSADVPDWHGMLPVWSPDSRQISIGTYGFREDKGLWVIDLEKKSFSQLVPGNFTMGVWSPDLKRMLIDHRRAERVDVWLVDLEEWRSAKTAANSE